MYDTALNESERDDLPIGEKMSKREAAVLFVGEYPAVGAPLVRRQL